MNVEKLEGTTLDVVEATIEKIKQTMPELLKDGKLDIEHLQNLCGDYVEDENEFYKFTWKGKSECYKIAHKQSTGTLRPCEEESVNFDGTNNLYIEGDNLEVLKILQKSYYGKVKMIYIDPPYNTGNDFVYEDDFKDPIGKYKEVTGQTTKSNAESMGRYHTNWLNMMWPRLRLSANLLREDGVIFVSIDDNEVHNLRKIMDEIFGEENFVFNISRLTKKGGKSTHTIANNNDNLLCYIKNENFVFGTLDKDISNYTNEDEFVETRGKYALTQTLDYSSLQYSKNMDYDIVFEDKSFVPGGDSEKQKQRHNGNHGITDWVWRWSKSAVEWGIKEKAFIVKNNRIYTKSYLKVRKKNGANEWEDIEAKKVYSTLSFVDNKYSNDNSKKELDKIFNKDGEVASSIFRNPKSTILILELLNMANVSKDDIILDFFSGSATTAHAVMQHNLELLSNSGGGHTPTDQLQYIMVQLPEVTNNEDYKTICEIGKERIRRAGAKILEENKDKENIENLDIGFKVLKLDTSNLNAWDTTPIAGGDEQQRVEDLLNRMESYNGTIKQDRTELDVVFEVMLKMGYPLTAPLIQKDIIDKKVYIISENLLICLDKNITADHITEFSSENIRNLVIAEESFEDSNAMSNAHYILKDKEVELRLL